MLAQFFGHRGGGAGILGVRILTDSIIFSISFIPPTSLTVIGLCSYAPNSSLVRTFSIRRSASGHFWFIKPSTSFNQPLPSSLAVKFLGLKKKLLEMIQKGCVSFSFPFGSFAAGFPPGNGKPDIFPFIHGRNSCCTCEWPNRKATYKIIFSLIGPLW